MKNPENPIAFPVDTERRTEPGMTLLDYHFSNILPELIKGYCHGGPQNDHLAVTRAYELATEAIKQRPKNIK